MDNGLAERLRRRAVNRAAQLSDGPIKFTPEELDEWRAADTIESLARLADAVTKRRA